MKMVILAYVMFSLLLVGTTQALSLEYYGIEDSINPDLSVDTTITLEFGEPVPHLEYQLGFFIENMTAKSNFDEAICDYTDNVEGSVIKCDFAGMTAENSLLQISFKTKDVISRLGENRRFSVNYGISLPVSQVFVKVKLPEDGALADPIINQSFSPHDGKTTLSDGKRIMVYWERTDISAGDNLKFSILYTTQPASLTNVIIYSVAALIVLFMVAIAIYVKRSSRKERDVVKSVLNADENTIVNILVQKGGSSVQKALVRETDFSKAKVSRIVKNLKNRGVVEIEPVSGRENRVVLKLKTEN